MAKPGERTPTRGPSDTGSRQRAAKLARELRANLKKRRAQARARSREEAPAGKDRHRGVDGGDDDGAA